MIALLLFACASDRLAIVVEGEHEAAVLELVDELPWERVDVLVSDDPEREARGRGHVIAVVDDGDDQTWTVEEKDARTVIVRGGGALGVQYGVADALERLGFRFFHPYRTFAPERLDGFAAPAVEPGPPAIARRGLHLHTLHPIEGLTATWLPGEGHIDEAERIIDWTITHRSNHLQWVALDDIIDSPATHADWVEHTRDVVDHAHARGLTVGVGIQLFGSGNLQEAFDLLDVVGTDDEDRAAIDGRLALLADVDWDLISLSFGEFFGEDPETFIAKTNLAVERIRATWPDAEITATVHVGDSEDQHVEYDGEDLIYYMLVKHADPQIVPWVHTVMFYNLYEDAGGAYHHDDFEEHRQFLLDELRKGERVGYHPESAYWVAFDNSVPQYFPLYVRSRWLDFDGLAADSAAEGLAPIDTHVLFSTGWEWGYWQNDYATMRFAYGGYGDWRTAFTEMYAPWGDDGAALADGIAALTELQRDAFIDQRLTAYVVGRDALMDGGYAIGIVSQPERVAIDDVAAMTAEERATFRSTIVDPLAAYAAAVAPVADDIVATGEADTWFAEIHDGAEIDKLRAAYVAALWDGVTLAADGADGSARLAEAEALLTDARAVVARRHAAFHDPEGDRWVDPAWENPTVYDYGYLLRADELCFWERELVQAKNVAYGTDEAPPGCGL